MTTVHHGGLHWIDLSIIGGYLALLCGIGWYFSRRQSSLHEFVRGGSKFGWLPLGLSLMAALNSGLDYINAPALVYGFGLVFVMSFLSWFILFPWIARVTVPFYRRLDVYSAYEYLEDRFGLGVRLVAAGVFVLWRVGWMGAALYVPCLAVSAMTRDGINIPLMVTVLGTAVTFYTMLGGVKAVIWSDVAQFCIMLTGLGATLWFIVAQVPGGVAEVVRVSADTGRLNVLGNLPATDGSFWDGFKVFFTTEVTLPGIVLTVLLGRMVAFTADQMTIQRIQSASSVRDASRTFVVNAVTSTVWVVALGFVGLALFAYFQHHPYPAGMKNDRVLPYFMEMNFPVGLKGLVIAAIFSASLSSVDSALNSATSVFMVDCYNRLWLRRKRPPEKLDDAEQRRQLRVSRLTNLGLGLVMVLIAANIGQMGEIYRACNKILGAFFGPLFGIFFLGMFCRSAHSLGVLVGALLGLSASCFASFFSELPWLQAVCGSIFGAGFVDFFRHLSWQWPSPIGIVVTLVVGLTASRWLPARRTDAPALTFREVMKRPELSHNSNP